MLTGAPELAAPGAPSRIYRVAPATANNGSGTELLASRAVSTCNAHYALSLGEINLQSSCLNVPEVYVDCCCVCPKEKKAGLSLDLA